MESGNKNSNLYSSSKKNSNQLLSYELANTLKRIIDIDSEVEKTKHELALKSDFNLFDAFRMFDKYNLGSLYKSDFEEGLNKIGVFGPRSAISLFFKKYDKDSDGKLGFAEFSDAFYPIDKIYRDHLDKKRPNYDTRNPEEAFCYSTKLDFSDAFRRHLRNETMIEDLR